MNQDDVVQELQRKYGLSYHVPYALRAQELVGFQKKRVLEVGGSLPKDFVLGELGAEQWIAVEDLSYWQEQPDQGGGSPPATTLDRTLAAIDHQESLPKYAVLSGRIEELPMTLYGQFDMVFSVAAFEHILFFPLALDRMYAALRSGGRLFTMFSPLWSAYDGHHLPNIIDKSGKKMGFHNSPIPPWGHLLMRPPSLLHHLLQHTDFETSARIVYYTYHSSHINRLFSEDYVAYIRASPFVIESLVPTFFVDVPNNINDELKRLYPGREHFANNGILAVLRKS
jgi:hypothetical protein